MKYRTVLCENNKHVLEVLNYIFKNEDVKCFYLKTQEIAP